MQQKIKQSQKIILVRHGERADDDDKEKLKVLVKSDPHLTVKGIEQSIIVEPEREKIIIITSLFLRCVQTSLQIKNQLENKQIKIFISHGFGEWLKNTWFSRNICQELEFSKNQQIETYPEEDQMIKPSYPESITQYNNRILANYQLIKGKFETVILVTHGIAIQSILTFHDQFDPCQPIDFCFYAILQN